MKKSRWETALRLCFALLVVGTFIFMVLALKNTDKLQSLSRRNDMLNDHWTYEKPDGSTEEITLPTDFRTKRGEPVIISRPLPDDLDDNCFLVLHEMKDLRVYVDDEERMTFSRADASVPGGATKGLYMFMELKDSDAGKTLTLVRDGNYINGIMREVYYGDAIGIVEYAFDREIISFTLAIVLAVISSIMAIVGAVMLFIEKKRNVILPLTAGILITALWLLFDGELFPFIFHSLYADGTLAFMLCMLIPIPLIDYLNQIQKGRYTLIHHICQTIVLLDFVVMTALHFSGTVIYIDSMPVMNVIIGIICLVEVVLIIKDVIQHKALEYKWSLIGMGVMCVFSILEMVLINAFTNRADGVWMIAGLYVALVLGTIQYIYDSAKMKTELIRKSKEVAQLNLATIITIANTVDAKDKYTGGHSMMVAKCSRDIGKQLGMTDLELQKLYNVALLHDIGKIAIPDYILNKPGKLSRAEYEVIKEHPTYGGDILNNTHLLEYVKEGVRYHHERWDGNGYPDGLKGEEIPLQARIICIADCFDAMNRNRVYRKSLTKEQMVDEYRRNAGKHFDPELAEVFATMLENGYDINSTDNGYSIDETNMESWLLNKVMNEYTYDLSIKAETDQLTGLLNNPYMKMEVNKILATEPVGALLMIDMDSFKQINDTNGHMVGDEVLRIFAETLRKIFRHEDLLARMGGDEFAVFMRGPVEKESVMKKVQSLCNDFIYHEELVDYADQLGVSIGIAEAPSDGQIMDELYEAADRALYYVKRNGKGGICFFSEVSEDLQDIIVPEEEYND